MKMIEVSIVNDCGNGEFVWTYPGTTEDLKKDWNKGFAPVISRHFLGSVREMRDNEHCGSIVFHINYHLDLTEEEYNEHGDDHVQALIIGGEDGEEFVSPFLQYHDVADEEIAFLLGVNLLDAIDCPDEWPVLKGIPPR